jgi:hypothetical protein
MSRGVKITLVVIGIVLVLCCIGGVATYFITTRAVSQAFTADSTQAAQIGHEIVDYTLPPGYHEQGAMNALVFKMVFISPQSDATDAMILALMQFPAGSNASQDEMEQQMRQALAQQGQKSNIQMRVVGTQKATIKGQPVALTISEGTTSEGQTLRQMMGIFPGKGGTAMLMAMSRKEAWDQEALDGFLASVK